MVDEGWSGVIPLDVTDRWPGGDDAPLSDQQITTLIGDAEDVILAAFPTMPDMVAAGKIPARRLTRVIARMIVRLMLNPEGVRTVQHQESAGGFNQSQSTTRAGDNPGELYLTDEDRRDLSPGTGRGAFAITPRMRGRR